MKKTALLFVLLLSAMTSASAQDLTQIYVRIGTGDDDLRGGSELTLSLTSKDGTSVKIPLIQGRRLADRTTTSRVYAVNPRLPLTSLTRASLSWTPGRCDSPCQTDQWWMTEFLLRVGAGPGDPSVKEAVENASRADSSSGLYSTLAVNDNLLSLPRKFEDRDQTVDLFVVTGAAMCQTDNDCNDRVFCNGVERCEPSNRSADARGCLASSGPACLSGTCNEARQMCEQSCTDNDGDGYLAAACGGNDCDDNDAARFPGNPELFNDNDKDQDCDPDTHGFFSSAANSRQLCDGRNQVVIASMAGGREVFTRATCVTGTVCVQQPNGDGVCMTEPAGYQAPGAARLPSGPQAMPAEPLYRNPAVRDRLLNTPLNVPLGGSKNNGDDTKK